MKQKIKMKQRLETLASYCTATRRELATASDWYTINDDGAYLAFRQSPLGPGAKILAVAHMDHLCSGKVHRIDVARGEIVSSALDDRAGVYAALELLPEKGIHADVLLTDDEESGNSTIRHLGAEILGRYNWLVQLDRRGTDVAVYSYDVMIPLLSDLFQVDRGSFTCITAVEDTCPVAAYNLGVAYQREHTERCTLNMHRLLHQIGKLATFADRHGQRRIDNPACIGAETMLRPAPRPLLGGRGKIAYGRDYWLMGEDDTLTLQQDTEDGFCTICDVPYTAAGVCPDCGELRDPSSWHDDDNRASRRASTAELFRDDTTWT